LLERDIQKACVEWARKNGWWARKFSSPANRSVPDYLFAKDLPTWYDKFAVEFKKPGGRSTEAQLEEQKAMRAAGWEVYEIDNVEAFKVLVSKRETGWLE
jgi:hypothetical protein